MGTFSYTSPKAKVLSMGNRRGYLYKLTNVQITGSKLTTPFRKITGYMTQNVSPNTSSITVAAQTEHSGSGTKASLTFAADAESQGYIIVVGLL